MIVVSGGHISNLGHFSGYIASRFRSLQSAQSNGRTVAQNK